MVFNVGEKKSVFNRFMMEIRDEGIQQDSMRFRRNIERIGEIMAYEVSKKLDYKKQEVKTQLGEAIVEVPDTPLVIASVLRAGLPLHNGLTNYFDTAENAFVSAYRKHHKDGSFDIEVEYISCPNLDGKTVLLADPMLATGSSMVLSYEALVGFGTPKHIHVISVIASLEGIEHVEKNLPENIDIWVGAVDEELTAQAYIVPGLGDAGDLAFGRKAQA